MAQRGGKQWRKNKPKVIADNIKKYGMVTCETCGRAPLIQGGADRESQKPYALKGVLMTIDHIQPISKGGTHSLMNLRVLCNKCNLSKGDS